MRWRSWLSAAFLSLCATTFAPGADRPNFLFILAEDMSPTLGCYGDPDARTPHLDAFAAAGIRYTRAYSATGVCATSRSAMITAMHPSSIGTQHMRSRVKLPDTIRPFPELLREAGYFCVNRGKQDFNFETSPDCWDRTRWREADWTKREKGQPFFAIFNFPDTHESRLWPESKTRLVDESLVPEERRHRAGAVSLPGWLPDTPEVRREWARHLDLIEMMDGQYIGPLLRRLETTGAADDTIVFFFSDHGAPFPRAKQWVTEAGTRVPLLIRFPEKWQHLAPSEPGSVSDRLVSLMDLGPSVFSLAGLETPNHWEGRAFLGPAAESPREFLVFSRDRMDERVDFIRAIRDSRFRYVRNFHPQIPPFPWLTYMEKLEASKAFRTLQKTGQPGRFEAFLAERKPVEELYDLQSDPDELVNLADDPAHRDILERMRSRLRDWMLATRDTGFLPEQRMRAIEENGGTVREWCADEETYPLDALARGEISLQDPSPVSRYHAALRSDDPDALRARLAKETDPDVRVALAWRLGDTGPLEAVLESDPPWTRVLALNALDALGDKAAPLRPTLETLAHQDENPDNLYDRWLAQRILDTLTKP